MFGNLQILDLSNHNIQDFQDINNCLNFLSNLRELHAAAAMDTISSISFALTSNSFSTSLQLIDLSYNNLNGTLPLPLFEDIPTLRHLNLANNNLAGTLPFPRDSFATGVFAGTYAYQGLPVLRFLDFSNNNLHGSLNLDWLFLSQIA